MKLSTSALVLIVIASAFEQVLYVGSVAVCSITETTSCGATDFFYNETAAVCQKDTSVRCGDPFFHNSFISLDECSISCSNSDNRNSYLRSINELKDDSNVGF